MPSFQDSIFLFVLALLLFGPKKLPELARYLGKLMNEFRRASSEFRLQMDDEFRAIEQAEQQKKIAAIEAAAPIAPLAAPEAEHLLATAEAATVPAASTAAVVAESVAEGIPERKISASPDGGGGTSRPLPIASNGDLHLMPPSTGLPLARSSNMSPAGSSSVSSVFDTIPHIADPVAVTSPGRARGAQPWLM